MIKKSIAVSLIQYNCPQEKGEALDNIFDLTEQAGSNPDLILIAETPYTPYTTVNDFTSVAEFIPGYYSDRLVQLAKMRNAYICSGIVEKDGNKIYNSAILISPDGDIIHKQRKISLAGCDIAGGFSPGSEIEIVETEFGKIGILICIDTSIEKHIYRMADLKPDIILVPAYGLAKSDYSKTLAIDCMVDECIEEWRLRMQMLAKFCKSYILRADHCGREGDQVRVGHSIAVTPGGYVISEATMKPAIMNITLDPSSPMQKSW